MLKNLKISKLVAGLIGFTMVVGVAFTGASSAKGATQAELEAQIASLLATIQGLQAQLAGMGGTPAAGAACSFTFTQNLTVGSTGAEVMNLQKFLNRSADTQVAASGAGSVGMETSTFGPATKAAVMKFQAKYAAEVLTPAGLTAPTGYWGALSRAKANALCSTPVPPVVVPPPGGTPDNGLEGTDGSISDVDEISSINNEEVGEGQDDIKVLGMDVTTSNDGDIALRSIRVSFDPTGNGATDSDNLDDYVEEVTVWLGSTKIGSSDADDFTENSSDVWERTITLSNAKIESDSTAKVYVAVTAASNLDSGDIDSDSWTVDVENVRFEDGSGVVTTDSTTGDIPGLDVPIDFVDFSEAADTELKISLDSTSPEAGIVMVDDESETDGVVLLKGKLKLEGTSDVVIDELPITLTSSSSTQELSDVASTLILKIGSEEYSESVPATVSTATITFDNLDFPMDPGTVSFSIEADINDVESGSFDEGDTLTASLTASNRNMMDVENEEGDQLTSTEKTGTATGEAQEFRTNGITAALVSVDEEVTVGQSADDDSATFTIKYKVTAVDEDVYISSLASSALTVAVDRAGTATTGGVSSVLTNNTDTDLTAVGNYLIEEGTTETFTLSVSVVPGQDGLYRAAITAIKWDTSDDTSPANSYTSNLDNFKTDYVTLN